MMCATDFEERLFGLVSKTSTELPEDVVQALETAASREDQGTPAAAVLSSIRENLRLAKARSQWKTGLTWPRLLPVFLPEMISCSGDSECVRRTRHLRNWRNAPSARPTPSSSSAGARTTRMPSWYSMRRGAVWSGGFWAWPWL